jgi:hypothetical protein
VQSYGNRYTTTRPYTANQQGERNSANSRTNSNNGWLGDRR